MLKEFIIIFSIDGSAQFWNEDYNHNLLDQKNLKIKYQEFWLNFVMISRLYRNARWIVMHVALDDTSSGCSSCKYIARFCKINIHFE